MKKKKWRILRDRHGKVIGRIDADAHNPSARTETHNGYTILISEVGPLAAHNLNKKPKPNS